MAKGHLAKLLRRKKRSAEAIGPTSGGGQRRDKHPRPSSGLRNHAAEPPAHAIDVDEQPLSHGTAYDSLVSALSKGSNALRLRRLQQEGDSDGEMDDEEEAEGEVEESDENDGIEEGKPPAAVAPVSDGPLDTWTIKGMRAAASLAGDTVGSAAAQSVAPQQPLALSPSSASAPDTWAMHVDKELTEAELEALRAGAMTSSSRLKPQDLPEHPDYKVRPKDRRRRLDVSRVNLDDAR